MNLVVWQINPKKNETNGKPMLYNTYLKYNLLTLNWNVTTVKAELE